MAVNDQTSDLTNEETSVLSNPNFQALVRERSGFGWTLTIIMLVIYYGFILLVAFGKGFMATKIGGGVTSIGMLIGLGVILSAVVLTGIYTLQLPTSFPVASMTCWLPSRACPFVLSRLKVLHFE